MPVCRSTRARNVKFEHIQIQNCDELKAGVQYYVYALDEDAFIGPTLLLASELKLSDKKHYAKIEVYEELTCGTMLRRTRRIREDR